MTVKLFRSLFAIDAVAVAIVLYFFLLGISDRSVSSFNIAIWLPLVAIPAMVLWGGHRLHATGHDTAAKLLLALIAVPGLLIGGWMLLFLILFETHPGAYR